MTRKLLIRTNQYFYHVYNRSNHKLWFDLPLEEVWLICQKSLKKAYLKHPVEVYQFVLMANHYHMLIKTPNSDIDLFMYEFNKCFSLSLRIRTNLINRMFGGRYKWTIIKSDAHVLTVLRYIYQNPTRAKIVKRCEDYPYSTLKNLLNMNDQSFLSIPIHNYFSWVAGDSACKVFLEFINEVQSSDKNSKIKGGLKKSYFKELSQRDY